MIKPQLAEFMRRMDKDSVAIIPAAREAVRSHDTNYRYRQNSDFFYLTGFEEPEAIAVIEESWGKPIDAALEVESRRIANVFGGPVQRNLLDVFFATEQVKKETGVADPSVRAASTARRPYYNAPYYAYAPPYARYQPFPYGQR